MGLIGFIGLIGVKGSGVEGSGFGVWGRRSEFCHRVPPKGTIGYYRRIPAGDVGAVKKKNWSTSF